jgi:predicted  nucleic acid-binding Zn-ribbon protein
MYKIESEFDKAEDALEKAIALLSETLSCVKNSVDASESAETNVSSIEGMIAGISDDAERGDLHLTRDLTITKDIIENTVYFVDDVLVELDRSKRYIEDLREALTQAHEAVTCARQAYGFLAANDFCDDALDDVSEGDDEDDSLN